MTIARAGLRLVYRKKLETIALVILVALVVFQHGVLLAVKSNVGYHVYEQIRDEMGDIAVGVPEADRSKVLNLLGSLQGVESIEARRLYWVKATIGNRTYFSPMISLDDLHGFAAIAELKEGEPPKEPGEAAIYTVVASGARGQSLEWVHPGIRVEVSAYTPKGPLIMDLTVSGVYKGFSWVSGTPYAIILPTVPDELEGYGVSILTIRLGQDADPYRVADRIRGMLEYNGIDNYNIIVNTPEKNPIVALIESAFNLLSIPASVMLVFAFILPAAAGSVTIFRDARILAVLRGMGAGTRDIAIYYMLPWLVRGFIGALLAVVVLVAYSDDIYFRLFVGDSDIARAMSESYGFLLDIGAIARASVTALIMVTLGSLIPLAASTRINTVEVLRTGGLPLAFKPPRISLPGPMLFRISIRDLSSRWWKLLGLMLSLALLWGITTAIEMESQSIDKVSMEFSNMRLDVSMLLSSLTPEPPRPVYQVAEDLASGYSGVESYSILYSEYIVVDLPGGETTFMAYLAILSGDPSIGLPLVEGRYPSGPGEAVISRYMATYLGLGVGSTLTIEVPRGGMKDFRIVGISSSPRNNGFYLVVDKGSGVFQQEPGALSVIVDLDLKDDEVEEFRGYVDKATGMIGYVTVPNIVTREDVTRSFETLASMVRVFYAGIAVLASIAAGIALAGIVLVDASSREKEHAVVMAMGAGRRGIIVSYIIQAIASLFIAAPIAFILGYIIASATARGTALAIGYIPPALDPRALFNSLLVDAVLVSLAFIAVAVALHLRRFKLPLVLRE